MTVTLKRFYWRAKTLTSYGESGWADAGFFYVPNTGTPSNSQLDHIYDSIVYNLKTIIKGNSNGPWIYNTTIERVLDKPADPENMPSLPAVNIYVMKERCVNNSSGFIQNSGLNRQILEMEFDVEFWVYGQAEDRRAWASGVLGDMKALFGNNSQLINELGDVTCFNILYSGGESHLLNADRPSVVQHAVFTVRYRASRQDPSAAI